MRYRRVVRPHLLARPPKPGGKAARCRVCGGDLPQVLEPIVACKYCRSESVVSRELFARNTAAAREGELAELGRARALAPAAQSTASWMKLAMGLSFTGSLITAAGCLWILYRALGATVR
jgi:hypothetical protein